MLTKKQRKVFSSVLSLDYFNDLLVFLRDDDKLNADSCFDCVAYHKLSQLDDNFLTELNNLRQKYQ